MSTPRVSYYDVDWNAGHEVVFEPHSPTYAECGNGIIDDGEDCDGENLGGATCESVMGDDYTGTLTCSSCGFDTSGCTYVGGGGGSVCLLSRRLRNCNMAPSA